MQYINSIINFTTEAISNYSSNKYDFSIIHTVTAIELAFKEKLSSINPALVYKNIDAKNIDYEYTVSIKDAISRLNNLGHNMSNDNILLLGSFITWRNQIIHNQPKYDKKSVMNKLPVLLNYLADYLKDSLNVRLKDIIPKHQYKIVNKIITSWQNEIDIAKKNASKHGNVLEDICPDCGVSNVLVRLPEDKIKCYFCDAKGLVYMECEQCGKWKAERFHDVVTGNWCATCINNYAEDYYSDMNRK